VSSHGRVLLYLADDPGMRFHDIAARLRVTEQSAHDIVTDLTPAGDISQHKDDRRNRHETVAHRPFPEPITREKTFREVLALLPGAPAGQPPAERKHR
jgi:MarR family